MARQFPSLEQRSGMIPNKSAMTEIKNLNSPPAAVFETTKMFFVMIDSFGIEMHPKVRAAIDAGMKGNVPVRTKVNRVDAGLTWSIIKAQLSDTRLLSKLAKIPELLEGDVAKPKTFMVAVDYYQMQRGNFDQNRIRQVSSAAGDMREFMDTIMEFQSRYTTISRTDMKNAKQSVTEKKQQIEEVKKEITTLKKAQKL